MFEFTYVTSFIADILGNLYFLLGINALSLVLKFFILSKLIAFLIKKNDSNNRSSVLLVIVLVCYIMQDITWIVSLTRSLWFPASDYRPYLFLVRVAWGFFALHYQALSLFLETIVTQEQKFSLRQKVFITISSFFFLFACTLACVDFNCLSTNDRPDLEFYMRNIEGYFTLLVLMLPALFIAARKMRSRTLPRVLKKQLKVLVPYLIVPMWLSDILQLFPLTFSPHWATNSYSAVGISTLLLTFAVYYSARKVIAFRFLNFNNHVQSIGNFNFIDNFKQVLEKLSHATTHAELDLITQTLFKQAFSIPQSKTTLYVRHKMSSSEPTSADNVHTSNKTAALVESFLDQHQLDINAQMHTLKILIYDEIAFNFFYDKNIHNRATLRFLETINADIFLPIYENNNLIAYIIVERHATDPQKFYGDTERDEMLVFASYLGNIINLMQNRNLKVLLHQEKELKDELYLKLQEINQYKESIKSFIRTTKDKEIGIIFYKNRHFVFGNKAAKELIAININAQQGHPITRALKYTVRQVEEYKAPYTNIIHDSTGNKLVISGVPNLEQNNVIITVCKPEVSDIIKHQITTLKDPRKWDYLLYLETTKSGKLINQLIPGSGELLLNFKIDLLNLALSNRAVVLQMPEEDLLPTVEIIHHISLREQLHIFSPAEYPTAQKAAIALFGLNPLFNITQESKPLLQRLDKTGTLFIRHIDLLDLECQEYLAEFLAYGLYRVFKSDQRVASDVRIICSTSKNITDLVNAQLFSKNLFSALKEASLSMPSLATLPQEELDELTQSVAEQTLQTNAFKNILELTEKEKHTLALKRPTSLHELRDKIRLLLSKKTYETTPETPEPYFDPTYQLVDPQLLEAARLGKRALRDPKLVALLWNKFKNHSKMATFLGVNRSSVNRRCKDYNIK